VNAELYALTHRGNAGDLAFYQDICRGARRVLELGSGYGRLLLALAAPKRQLVGLERDMQFLALARRNLRQLPEAKRKAIRLLHGDMTDFTIEQGFERILLPYNTLYCLLTRRAALSCFRAARRALLPGGTLAFDVWNAESFQHNALPPRSSTDNEPIVTLEHAGRTWDVFEQLRVRRAQQRLLASYTYLPRGGGSAVCIPIAQRYYLADELTALLDRAGFAVEARFGDFSRKRYVSRSPQQIVLARAI